MYIGKPTQKQIKASYSFSQMFWFADLNRTSNKAYRNKWLDFAYVIKIFEEDH